MSGMNAGRRQRPRISTRPVWPWERVYWLGENNIELAFERDLAVFAYSDLHVAAMGVVTGSDAYSLDVALTRLRNVALNGSPE